MARAPLWPLDADGWLKAVPLGTPLPTVTQRYNEMAQRHGWPQRTQRAVEQRWRALVPRPKGLGIPVRCLATGQQWRSIRSAAIAHFLSPPALEEAFQRHGRWGGIGSLRDCPDNQGMMPE
jgi:hypothetical protein